MANVAAPNDLGIGDLGPADRIATGGSATVYRAHQARFGREVAVKVFHDRTDGDDRVAAERLALGAVSANAGAVTVLDDGVTTSGEPYLLFPFFARGSLHHWVRRHGPLPLGDALFLLQPVADTLADLHASELAHRDVKPGNILLTDRFRPRLTDFGVATPIGTMAPYAFTPGYGAPESAPGMPPRPTDAGLDVHGFGATLCFVLTGATPEDAREATGDTRRRWDELPEPIRELIERCTATDPADRPPDGTAVAAQLRRAGRLAERDLLGAADPTGGADVERRVARRPAIGPMPALATVRDRWPWLVTGAGALLVAGGLLA